MATDGASAIDNSRVILITGANTGLGLAIVKALLGSPRPYVVLLGGRSLDKANAAAENVASLVKAGSAVEPFQIDVEDDTSIKRAFKTIASTHSRIDCLINNAGGSFDALIADGALSARQAWSASWDINVTGAPIVTTVFMPLLLRSSDPRLLFITSGLSSLAENAEGDPRYPAPAAGWPKCSALFVAYRCSKAGLNMMMLEWARMLKNDGVKVWSLAPGLLATGLGNNIELLRKLGAVDPSIGGEVVRGVVEGDRDDDAGKVIRGYKSPIQPW